MGSSTTTDRCLAESIASSALQQIRIDSSSQVEPHCLCLLGSPCWVVNADGVRRRLVARVIRPLKLMLCAWILAAGGSGRRLGPGRVGPHRRDAGWQRLGAARALVRRQPYLHMKLHVLVHGEAVIGPHRSSACASAETQPDNTARLSLMTIVACWRRTPC